MKPQLCLLLVGNVLLWLFFCAFSCLGDMTDRSNYIYLTETKKHFVQEVIGDSDVRPDSIYSPHYPNGRVVTYYAHWCPHCLHFKPKYMEFSNEVHEMSKKLRVNVEVFAVSCVPHAKICMDNGIHGYPTIMYYPPYSINGTKFTQTDLHSEEIFRITTLAMRKETEHVNMRQGSQRSDKGHDKIRQKAYFIQRTKTETFRDAHLSFHFAMTTAIFTQPGPLPEKPRKALLAFLNAMKRTIPSNSSMQPVVRDLLKNFDAIVMEPMALNKIMGNHPPPGPISKWSRASSQHGTGYTAGLWILFHIMSVGLVKWNHLATDDGQMIIPAAMADIQRNYVEHFFQCEECRLNFLSDFDACMFDRCNRLITLANGGTLEQFIQYPLWLYETHNGVNVRLRNERIEQGIESESFTTQAEISWPPASSCPLCWLSREKDRWDELEVYKFLEQSYWYVLYVFCDKFDETTMAIQKV